MHDALSTAREFESRQNSRLPSDPMQQATLLSRFKTIKEKRRTSAAVKMKMKKWKAHLQKSGEDYMEFARRTLPNADIPSADDEHKVGANEILESLSESKDPPMPRIPRQPEPLPAAPEEDDDAEEDKNEEVSSHETHTRGFIVRRTRANVQRTLRNTHAHYSKQLGLRILRALGTLKSTLAVVQTKSLQVPKIIHVEWIKPVLRNAAGGIMVGDINASKKGHLFTHRGRLAKAVDPACHSAAGTDQAGNECTAGLIVSDERPVLMHYLKVSETLLMRFWARKVGKDGTLALRLGA